MLLGQNKSKDSRTVVCIAVQPTDTAAKKPPRIFLANEILEGYALLRFVEIAYALTKNPLKNFALHSQLYFLGYSVQDYA